jgi:hypothetical protein
MPTDFNQLTRLGEIKPEKISIGLSYGEKDEKHEN